MHISTVSIDIKMKLKYIAKIEITRKIMMAKHKTGDVKMEVNQEIICRRNYRLFRYTSGVETCNN